MNVEKLKNNSNLKKGESKVGIYSPWIIFYRQIEALFKEDPEVRVKYVDETHTIQLFVDNRSKADALTRILPTSRTYGNVKVSISVIPANIKYSVADDFTVAFSGNRAVSHFTRVDEIPGMVLSNPITYCVFNKKVVQYPADDLSSESGVASTLYQDLAKEIFCDTSTDGVYFCTDTE